MQSLRYRERWIPQGSQEVKHDGINAVVYISRTEKSLSAIGYRGKANKHAFNYLFRSEAQLQEHITGFFKDVKAHQDYREEIREKRKLFVTTLKPGDMLHTSWGYEQTNVEFFQVLSVVKNTVIIREVAQNRDETGFMSGRCSPIKDNFIGPELKKRVSDGEEIKIDDCRYAWKFDGKDHYYSTYA
jgi:hypothetical protein